MKKPIRSVIRMNPTPAYPRFNSFEAFSVDDALRDLPEDVRPVLIKAADAAQLNVAKGYSVDFYVPTAEDPFHLRDFTSFVEQLESSDTVGLVGVVTIDTLAKPALATTVYTMLTASDTVRVFLYDSGSIATFIDMEDDGSTRLDRDSVEMLIASYHTGVAEPEPLDPSTVAADAVAAEAENAMRDAAEDAMSVS